MKTLKQMIEDLRLGKTEDDQPLKLYLEEFFFEYATLLRDYSKTEEVDPKLRQLIELSYASGAISALCISQHGMAKYTVTGEKENVLYFSVNELLSEAEFIRDPKESLKILIEDLAESEEPIDSDDYDIVDPVLQDPDEIIDKATNWNPMKKLH